MVSIASNAALGYLIFTGCRVKESVQSRGIGYFNFMLYAASAPCKHVKILESEVSPSPNSPHTREYPCDVNKLQLFFLAIIDLTPNSTVS